MNEIESILDKDKLYIGETIGDSMQPMLKAGRDRVLIVPPTFPLKRYDVPVYRRDGHYTMHRIVKVTKNGYVICGDNRARLERDITDSDIVGVLAGFCHDGQFVYCDDEEYIKYAKKICRHFPIRLMKSALSKVLRKFIYIKKRET